MLTAGDVFTVPDYIEDAIPEIKAYIAAIRARGVDRREILVLATEVPPDVTVVTHEILRETMPDFHPDDHWLLKRAMEFEANEGTVIILSWGFEGVILGELLLDIKLPAGALAKGGTA